MTKIGEVLDVVADTFGTTPEYLRSEKRDLGYANARCAFYFVASHLLDFSGEEISSEIGRSPSSCITLAKRAASKIVSDTDFRCKLSRIIAKIPISDYNSKVLFEEIFEGCEDGSLSAPAIREKLKKRRTRDQFNDPDKERYDQVNRSDKLYSARVDPSIPGLIDDFRKKSGMTKREITETALREFLERHDKS
ncbi:hypothetical protein [Maritalea sp.]|uniref:hypothetical protein n=1 Tax=Maritalea sp. TaxID=2003361 RepID=UPI003EF94806